MRTTDRERKGQRTRRHILEAARRAFAEVGYERATIRGIAATAEVDKSSVIQYFGTKANLFREAVHWQLPVAQLTSEDSAETARNYLQALFDGWAHDPDGPMAILLRAAMTSDDAAEILRTQVTEQAVTSVAATLTAPDARLRAALLSAVLMGVAGQRYLLRLPDLAAADTEDIIALLAPMLEFLLAPKPTG